MFSAWLCTDLAPSDVQDMDVVDGRDRETAQWYRRPRADRPPQPSDGFSQAWPNDSS